MIDVVVSRGVVEAVDVEKNEVTIEFDGWQPTADGPRLDRRVDATVTGLTSGLRFRDAAVAIESAAADRWTVFDAHTGSLELPAGGHLVQVEGPVLAYVALAGPCVLSRREWDGTFAIHFPQPTAVRVGFRSRVDRPRHAITVPATFRGAVTAVRHLSAAIDTDTPDKSYPSRRAHPPLIETGPSVEIPGPVRLATTTSAITVAIPPAIEPLLVTAPLVYYLQADLDVVERGPVRLDAPTLSTPWRLGASAPLEADVADVLRRVFFLDCLVRNAGPYGVPLREFELLDRLDIDADDLYVQSTAERLARYRRVQYRAVAPALPDWHLSTVVTPTLRNVRALPYLLDRMSLVQRPDPVPVGRHTADAESVPLTYAARSDAPGARLADRPVRNASRLGVNQGWLAAGTPIDAFRATLAAFENRFRYHQSSDGPRRVVLVINDESMLDEGAGVERIYASRSTELAIDVTVEEAVTRAELADILQSPVDFLHYIGHCERTGLRCLDGTLSATDVGPTNVQTFFLNACDSFAQGLELVKRGSVAGAVTLHDVLNPEATDVGVAFARLVMHGFSVSHALALASRHSLSNKFYTVVGDGTHRLSQGEDAFPTVLVAERLDTDEFGVEFHFPQSSVAGGLAVPVLPDVPEPVLRGCPVTAQLDTDSFVDFLTNVNVPVGYDGRLYWSTALAEQLHPDRPTERPADV
jgi:hypothetical protein